MVRRNRWLTALAISTMLSACQPVAVAPTGGSVPVTVSNPGSGAPPSPRAPLPSEPIAATPSTVAFPPAAFETYRWAQASIQVEPHSLVASVAHTSFGWVAVGVRINLPTEDASFAPNVDPLADLYSGEIWTSPDGRTWTEHADGPEFRGARIGRVIAAASGALAFGLGGFCLPDACSGLPPNGGTIEWASSDGDQWERLTDTGLGEGALVDVAQTDHGLVAVGYVANDGSKPDHNDFGAPTDAAVWRSVDGHHWTAVAKLPVADRLFRVEAHGSHLVALSSIESKDSVWTSADAGRTWKVGPALDSRCCWDRAIRGSLMVSATRNDLGAGPVGGVVTTLQVDDGTRTRDAPASMRDVWPSSIQTIGASFVMFGSTTTDSATSATDGDPVVFSSPDGVHWMKTTVPDAWIGHGVVAVADNRRDLVVIVAPPDLTQGPTDDQTETLWLGTVPN
jgi:hypothetical protein